MTDAIRDSAAIHVWVDRGERWPNYFIFDRKEGSTDADGDIPVELWERFTAAGKAYNRAEDEILDLLGVDRSRD